MKKPTRAAPANHRAAAEDLHRQLGEALRELEVSNNEIMAMRARLQEVRGERDDWKKRADAMDDQRRHAENRAHEYDADATRQSRKAEFWKGVAMGLDQAKAIEIEARQRQQYSSGGLTDILYKQNR